MDAADAMNDACPGCRAAKVRIAEVEARVLQLEGVVRDLLDQISRLQGKLPASRPHVSQPPAPAKKSTGRTPGGQPGHPPHLKQLMPVDRLKDIIRHLPSQCRACQAELPVEAGPNDPPPARHQIAELPSMAAEIVEHQGHYRTCPECGEITHQAIPAAIRARSVGPRLTGFFAYLAGCHGMSKRAIEEVSASVLEAPVSPGTISNLEQETSAALAVPHQEVREAIAAAAVKHADETGWKLKGKKRWLWVAATRTLALFVIHAKRSLDALVWMVGAKFVGVLCSDRWMVYDEWPAIRRQVCWAHLNRNWEQHQERGGAAKKLADEWFAISSKVFDLWHAFRGGGLTRTELGDRMADRLMEAADLLDRGTRSRDPKLTRFCTRLAKMQQSMWTFVVEPGVEPTNNHAERTLRRAVLWRKRSFGCSSDGGCRFVERILTAVQTLRLQKRPVLAYLQAAIAAHREGASTPSLIQTG